MYGLGFRAKVSTMENAMEKRLEDDMASGLVRAL